MSGTTQCDCVNNLPVQYLAMCQSGVIESTFYCWPCLLFVGDFCCGCYSTRNITHICRGGQPFIESGGYAIRLLKVTAKMALIARANGASNLPNAEEACLK